MDVIFNRPHGQIDHGHSQISSANNQLGITLIELMTVLAIIAISLAVGIPSVSAIIQTNRMATAMNSLSGSFALARSEAVTRNQEVVVCKSQDGLFCTKKGGWEQGWIVFEDTNGNEFHDEEEPRLWVQGNLPPGIEVSFSAFHSKNYVYYWPSGFTKMNGTFTFCQQNRPGLSKAMILNKIGRLRSSKTLHDGSPLECGEIS